MGIPADPILDIMRRSLINLEFIDRNYEEHAVYEITRLVNTFLGFLSILHRVFYCQAATNRCQLPDRRVRPHNNPNAIKQIESITIWNIRNGRKVLKCTIGTCDMKRLLLDFRNCLEEIHGQ